MYNAQAAYVDTLSKAENTGKSVAVFYITSKEQALCKKCRRLSCTDGKYSRW